MYVGRDELVTDELILMHGQLHMVHGWVFRLGGACEGGGSAVVELRVRRGAADGAEVPASGASHGLHGRAAPGGRCTVVRPLVV